MRLSQAFAPTVPVLHAFGQASDRHWGIVPRTRGTGFKLIALARKPFRLKVSLLRTEARRWCTSWKAPHAIDSSRGCMTRRFIVHYAKTNSLMVRK
jgi:hypothetical protein